MVVQNVVVRFGIRALLKLLVVGMIASTIEERATAQSRQNPQKPSSKSPTTATSSSGLSRGSFQKRSSVSAASSANHMSTASRYRKWQSVHPSGRFLRTRRFGTTVIHRLPRNWQNVSRTPSKSPSNEEYGIGFTGEYDTNAFKGVFKTLGNKNKRHNGQD